MRLCKEVLAAYFAAVCTDRPWRPGGGPLRAVSVADEITELVFAIEAARLITECLAHEQLATSRDVREAPRQAAAVLNLVAARLRLLCRAAQGSVDPQLLLEGFNAVQGADDIGLVLTTWARGAK